MNSATDNPNWPHYRRKVMDTFQETVSRAKIKEPQRDAAFQFITGVLGKAKELQYLGLPAAHWVLENKLRQYWLPRPCSFLGLEADSPTCKQSMFALQPEFSLLHSRVSAFLDWNSQSQRYRFNAVCLDMMSTVGCRETDLVLKYLPASLPPRRKVPVILTFLTGHDRPTGKGKHSLTWFTKKYGAIPGRVAFVAHWLGQGSSVGSVNYFRRPSSMKDQRGNRLLIMNFKVCR